MSIKKIKSLINYGGVNGQPPIWSPLIADFNGDGNLDYLFTTTEIGSNTPEPVKIFLSNVNGNLTDFSGQILNNFGSLWTQKIIGADFNNDGLLDVFLGQAPEQGNSRTDGSNGNNNSNVQNWGNQQYVLFQNSDGTFTPKKIYSGIIEAHYTGIGDFNNDGYQDILIVSDIYGQNSPVVLLNDKHNSFIQANTNNLSLPDSGISFQSFYASIGDFNNDGNLDIILLNGGYGNGKFNFLALGNGDGSFTKGPILPLISDKYGGASSTIEGSTELDLNGDGKLDLIIWVTDRREGLGDLSPYHLMVFINNSDGSFTDQTDKWLGNFTTIQSIGGDTRSLKGYLPGTKLIPINIVVSENGNSLDGYLHENIFLYNTGNKLIPIFDPYWNNQFKPDFSLLGQTLNGVQLNLTAGSTIYNLSWTKQNNGNIQTIYKDFNGNMVLAQLDPSNELSYYTPHYSFLTIDPATNQSNFVDGFFASGSANYGQWQYSSMPLWVQNSQREIIFTTPANRIIIGEGNNDYISAGNAYAGKGNNTLIANGTQTALMGGVGNDVFIPATNGKTYIASRGGVDTIFLPKNMQSYTITHQKDGSYEITNNNVDVIADGVTNINFSDTSLNILTNQKSSTVSLGPYKYFSNQNETIELPNEIYIGQDNNNTIIVNAISKNFTITVNGTLTQLTDNVGKLGTETLINTQKIQFSDQTIDLTTFNKMSALGLNYVSNQISSLVELYVASFNRAPDSVGLDYWGGRLSDGMSLEQIAKSFFTQKETIAAYPLGMATKDFVTTVYNNVLSRGPDTDGLNYWVGQLDKGIVSKDSFLLAIINGAMAPTGSVVDRQTLANKEAVGEHYAIYQGLNNSTNWAKDVMSAVTDQMATVTAANAKSDAYAAIAANPATSDLVVKLVGVAV